MAVVENGRSGNNMASFGVVAAMAVTENGRSSVAGFGAVRPQLLVDAPRALDALAFYKRAFCAHELKRTYHPKRKAEQEQPLILQSLLLLGSSQIIVSDHDAVAQDSAQDIVKSPANLKGTSMILELETDDLEAAVAMALEAGATVVEEVMEKPSGRSAKILDPFGFVWGLFTPVTLPEDVEDEDEDNEEEEDEEEEAEEGEEGAAAAQDEE